MAKSAKVGLTAPSSGPSVRLFNYAPSRCINNGSGSLIEGWGVANLGTCIILTRSGQWQELARGTSVGHSGPAYGDLATLPVRVTGDDLEIEV